MSPETLEKSIDLFLSMPSDKLTLEFQGGESTLNMGLIRQAVAAVNRKNTRKDIQFVVCTNLCELNDEDLDFLLEHNFSISTSLDGPQALHDANRKYAKSGAWSALISTLNKIKRRDAFDRVSALMTTTRPSLDMAEEIINEYVSQDFAVFSSANLILMASHRNTSIKSAIPRNNFWRFMRSVSITSFALITMELHFANPMLH
jgi:sulfatase maturation enzyme AslB (radical SAM superfamily)